MGKPISVHEFVTQESYEEVLSLIRDKTPQNAQIDEFSHNLIFPTENYKNLKDEVALFLEKNKGNKIHE